MDEAPELRSQEPVVFFVHVMKTGGTTVIQSLLKKYPRGSYYPEDGVDGMMIEAKGLTRSFSRLTPERRAALRWISPHLPLSVATRFRSEEERPVAIAMVLRDGVERAVSHLRNLSRRFNHDYTYQELIDLPVLRDFFFSNHQTRVLSVGEAGWQDWDRSIEALTILQLGIDKFESSFEVKPVVEADLERAIAGLHEVDVLGIQSEFDDWWQRSRKKFNWPKESSAPANVTSKLETGKAPPIPDSVIEELRERNQLDMRLYAAARNLLKS
jgi:hypothetical protein